MLYSPDLLHQLTTDRQQELLRSAAAQRVAESSPVRRHIANSLRRAADRLDAATGPSRSVSGVHLGRG